MVEAIQQPQEEFPGHALPTAHQAGEIKLDARLKVKLLLVVSVAPAHPKDPCDWTSSQASCVHRLQQQQPVGGKRVAQPWP